jgi:hypothetical protein
MAGLNLKNMVWFVAASMAVAQDMDMGHGGMDMGPSTNKNMTPEQQMNANRTLSIGYVRITRLSWHGFETDPFALLDSISRL